MLPETDVLPYLLEVKSSNGNNALQTLPQLKEVHKILDGLLSSCIIINAIRNLDINIIW